MTTQTQFDPTSGFFNFGSPSSPVRQTSYDWTSVNKVAISAIPGPQQSDEVPFAFSLPQSPMDAPQQNGDTEEPPAVQEEVSPRKSGRKRTKIEPYPVCLETRKSTRASKKKHLSPEPEAESDSSSTPLSRQERNRISALKYRERRRKYIGELESANAELKAKVESLSAALAKTQAQLAKALSENASLMRRVDLLE